MNKRTRRRKGKQRQWGDAGRRTAKRRRVLETTQLRQRRRRQKKVGMREKEEQSATYGDKLLDSARAGHVLLGCLLQSLDLPLLVFNLPATHTTNKLSPQQTKHNSLR